MGRDLNLLMKTQILFYAMLFALCALRVTLLDGTTSEFLSRKVY